MKENQQSFNFRFFSKQEIDKKFNDVIQQCSNLESFEKVIAIINDIFYNRLLLMLFFDKNTPDLRVYRVSRIYEGFDPIFKKSFSYPPDPKLGRANLKSVPVLYCSFDPATALREMKSVLNSGETLYVSEWRIKFTQEVYAHTVLINSKTLTEKLSASELIKNQLDHANKLVQKAPEFVGEGLKQFLLRIGDLFTLPNEKFYNITSAYAHDALYEAKKKGGNISMLLYPSVVSGHDGINFAIHPDFLNSSMMELNKVFKLKVNEVNDNGINVSVSEKGIMNSDGIIDWKKPTITIKNIDYDKIGIYTHDKNMFSGAEALNMPINNSSRTVNDWIKGELNKVDLLSSLIQIPFNDNVFEFNSAEREFNLIFQISHGSKIETKNLDPKNGCNCINYVQLPITYIDNYT